MKIGTHNGEFHADDAFAVAALQIVFQGEEMEIVRSRDPKVLAECGLRVDVGGVSNPATGDFDHHQRGGAGARDNGIPYAAFGLVWKVYGEEVCSEANRDLAEIAAIVDQRLVQSVDAADCGFALESGLTVEGVLPYTVSSAISALNPYWHEKPSYYDLRFKEGVEMAREILGREIKRAEAIVFARQDVRLAIGLADDPRLIVLESGCPWEEMVLSSAPDALYVAFPSETGDWRLQCVPPALGSFEMRKPLPESWAGKRGSDLAGLTAVEDAIFCHPGRFIAGAQSREGVLRLAELALAD